MSFSSSLRYSSEEEIRLEMDALNCVLESENPSSTTTTTTTIEEARKALLKTVLKSGNLEKVDNFGLNMEKHKKDLETLVIPSTHIFERYGTRTTLNEKVSHAPNEIKKLMRACVALIYLNENETFPDDERTRNVFKERRIVAETIIVQFIPILFFSAKDSFKTFAKSNENKEKELDLADEFGILDIDAIARRHIQRAVEESAKMARTQLRMHAYFASFATSTMKLAENYVTEMERVNHIETLTKAARSSLAPLFEGTDALEYDDVKRAIAWTIDARAEWFDTERVREDDTLYTLYTQLQVLENCLIEKAEKMKKRSDAATTKKWNNANTTIEQKFNATKPKTMSSSSTPNVDALRAMKKKIATDEVDEKEKKRVTDSAERLSSKTFSSASSPPLGNPILKPSEVLEVIRDIKKEKAVDANGFVVEHLQGLVNGRFSFSPFLLRMFALYVTHAARSGSEYHACEPNAVSALYTSRLIAIDKKGKPADDKRPIAIPSLFVKIIEKCLLAKTKKATVEMLNADKRVGDFPKLVESMKKQPILETTEIEEIEDSTFQPNTQTAVHVKQGLDQTVLRVQKGMENMPDGVTVKCDMSNAFNAINTGAILEALEEAIEQDSRFLVFVPYALKRFVDNDNILRMHTPESILDKKNVTLTSKKGTCQGAPASPLFFVLAFSHLLNKHVTEPYKNDAIVLTTAYADDSVIQIDSAEKAVEIIGNVTEKMRVHADLNMRVEKVLPHSEKARETLSSSFLSSSSDDDDDAYRLLLPPLKTTSTTTSNNQRGKAGFTLLGVPIGSDEYIEEAVAGIAGDFEKAMNGLTSYAREAIQKNTDTSTTARVGEILFRMCGQSRLSFILSKIHPRHFSPEVVETLQRAIMTAYYDVTGISSIHARFGKEIEDTIRHHIETDPVSNAILHMPLSIGGFGITNVANEIVFSYLAATCRARGHADRSVPTTFRAQDVEGLEDIKKRVAAKFVEVGGIDYNSWVAIAKKFDISIQTTEEIWNVFMKEGKSIKFLSEKAARSAKTVHARLTQRHIHETQLSKHPHLPHYEEVASLLLHSNKKITSTMYGLRSQMSNTIVLQHALESTITPTPELIYAVKTNAMCFCGACKGQQIFSVAHGNDTFGHFEMASTKNFMSNVTGPNGMMTPTSEKSVHNSIVRGIASYVNATTPGIRVTTENEAGALVFQSLPGNDGTVTRVTPDFTVRVFDKDGGYSIIGDVTVVGNKPSDRSKRRNDKVNTYKRVTSTMPDV